MTAERQVILVNLYRKLEYNLKRDRPMVCLFFIERISMRFYPVDQEYITYLQQYEPKVPNIGYAVHTKFVCGIVLNIHDANYFASISSNTKKFRTSFAYGIYPFDCTAVVYVPGHGVCFVGIKF